MSTPINIKVLKDYAEVSYTHASKKQTKIMSLTDIPGLFDTKISFDSGPLPLFGQMNAYGIHRIIQKDKSTTLFIQGINPYVNQLHHGQADESEIKRLFEKNGIPWDRKLKDVMTSKNSAYCYNNVYYPNLLMTIHLTEQGGRYQVTRSGLLAFQDAFLTDGTQLYDLPFANVHSSNIYGQICWGGNSPAPLANISQAVGLIHNFLGYTMNNDLFRGVALKGGGSISSAHSVLAYLALRSDNITSFPYDEINMTKNTKYRDLISYAQQNFR